MKLSPDSLITMEGIRELRRMKDQGKELPDCWPYVIRRTQKAKQDHYERNGFYITLLQMKEIDLHIDYLIGKLPEEKKIENDYRVFVLIKKQESLYAEGKCWERK